MALATHAYSPQTLAAVLAGLQTTTVADVPIGGLALDSRQVRPGDLFLACPGLQQHGLDHAEQAIAAGAVAIAWDAHAQPELTVPTVQVADLAAQVGAIAARFWHQPSQDMFVAGITGTDGKTSCAYLLAQALDRLERHCGYLGTLGYGFVNDWQAATHTTPDAVTLQAWLARLRAGGAQATALEVSSHALAQQRVQAVDFDVAMLTNIGRDHLDYHGDMAHYAAAKRRLFDMPGLDWAVLNIDDEYGRQWLSALPSGVQPLVYGSGAQAAQLTPAYVALCDLQTHAQGLTLRFDTHAGAVAFDSALIGQFNAANLAGVLAVLLTQDVAPTIAAEILAQLDTVPGRMQAIRVHEQQPLVVVDYAHTPNALDQALRAVCAHASGRVHCVFGCGGDRDRGKRPLMGAVAARYADALWITDDNPRNESPQAIVADIVAGIAPGVSYMVEHNRLGAIVQAIQSAQPGDVVLIAGKGHETTQQIGQQRRAHDDRSIARGVLEAL